jgi:hypothetical protein
VLLSENVDTEELHRALLDALPSDLKPADKEVAYFSMEGSDRRLPSRSNYPLRTFLNLDLSRHDAAQRTIILSAMVNYARFLRVESGSFLSGQRIKRISRTADVAYNSNHGLDVLEGNELRSSSTTPWLRHICVASTALGYCYAAHPAPFVQTAAELGIGKADVTKSLNIVEEKFKIELFGRDRSGKARTAIPTLAAAELYPALVEICRGTARLTALLVDAEKRASWRWPLK